MAIKKTIEIEIKDNVNVTTDHFEDLNDEIKSVKKQADDLSKSFQNNGDAIEKSFKPLKTQFREAQQQVAELSEKFGATSREAINAAKRAAELKDAIADAKDLTDAFNPDAKFNALSNSIGGALNGFQVFEGTLGLIGVESEDLQKTLLKVQSAMALSQGLQGLMEAKDSFIQLGAVIKTQLAGAFSTLRNTIITTGIGALVVGIGLLLPKIIDWIDVTGKAKKKQEDLNDSLLKQQKAIKDNRDELEKDLDFRLRYAQALGKSDKELLEIQKKNAYEKKKLIFEEIEAAKNRLKALREADLGSMASSKEEYLELVANNKKKREEVVKEIKELQNQIKSINQEVKIAEADLNTKQREDSKKTTTEKKENKKEEIEINKEANKELIELQNEIEKATEDNFNRTQTQQQLEIKAVEDKYFILLEKAREYGQDTIELEKARDAELRAIKDKSLEDEGAKLRAFYEQMMSENQKQSDKDKLIQKTKVDVARDSFNAISSFADSFHATNKKQQKALFNIKKAADLSAATIDGYRAVLSTYAQTPGGPLLKGAAATVAGVFAAAQIVKIASAKFDEGGSSGGNNNISTDSGTNQQAQQAPSFNLVGNGGIGQLQTLNQAPVQAYVVSGEVTSQQALDRNRLRNATL